MKKIEIRKQVSLSFVRVFEICLNGIYHRFFRAMVTLAIVSVAVAFMMYMMSSSVIGRNAYRQVRTSAYELRMYDRWVAWLGERISLRNWFRLLAQSPVDDPRIEALRRWTDLTDDEFQDVLAMADNGSNFLRFFESLPPGKRFVLTASKGDVFLLDWLTDADMLALFLDRMHGLGDVRWRSGEDALRQLITAYSAARPLLQRMQDVRIRAVSALYDRYPGHTPADLLSSPPSGFMDTLGTLGFTGPSTDVDAVLSAAAYQRDLQYLARLLREREISKDLARLLGVNLTDISLHHLCRLGTSRSGVQKILDIVRRNEETLPLNPDRVVAVSEWALDRERIFEIEAAASQFAEAGFGAKTIWLIAVSCLVCVVGIANAMLMSVVERFREIATIKCLGGTDGFVMILFVTESMLQGVVGGLAGTVLGFTLAMPVALSRYGAVVWGALPWNELGVVAGISIVVGMVLAALASVYPSFVASRLAPMEAMQVE